MKKIICMMLAVMMIASMFAGCTKPDSKPDESVPETTAAATTATINETDTPIDPADITIETEGENVDLDNDATTDDLYIDAIGEADEVLGGNVTETVDATTEAAE